MGKKFAVNSFVLTLCAYFLEVSPGEAAIAGLPCVLLQGRGRHRLAGGRQGLQGRIAGEGREGAILDCAVQYRAVKYSEDNTMLFGAVQCSNVHYCAMHGSTVK